MLIRHLTEATRPYSPREVDPALMTWEEYRKLVNPGGKHHPDSAYNWSLRDMNEMPHYAKSKYPILIQQVIRRGIPFDIRMARRDLWAEGSYCKRTPDGTYLQVDGQYVRYTPEECEKLGLDRYRHNLAAFNPEGECVGIATDDEWGCILVAVAQEYRAGFGLGLLLGKAIYWLRPDGNTGGTTNSGSKMMFRIHQEFVRDYLRTGTYSLLVHQGTLTAERVREITASAHLEDRLPEPRTGNLDSSDPGDWLLYGQDGCFILYDRKLAEIYQEGDASDIFKEKMFKGLVYAIDSTDGTYQIVKQFGGDSDKIKRFMLHLALSDAARHGQTIRVNPEWHDDEIIPYMDPRFAVVRKRQASLAVAPIDWHPMARAEAAFRKSFDRYGEFRYYLLDMAHAKYQPVPEAEDLDLRRRRRHRPR